MKKIKKKLLILAMPIVASLLILVTVISAVQAAEQQMVAILSGFGDQIMLQCEGTYSENKIDLHIWSVNSAVSTDNVSITGDSAAERAVAWAKAMTDCKKYRYVYYRTSHKSCPACKCGNGWNCIGFISAAYYHGGGVPIKCSNSGLLDDGFANKITLARWKARNGQSWIMLDNGGKKSGPAIDEANLKVGDILLCYNSSGKYKHTAMYAGAGMIYDCSSGHKGPAYRKYSSLGSKPTIAFRYTGDGGVTSSSESARYMIDFEVTATGKHLTYDLLKKDAMAGGNLNASAKISDDQFKLSGSLGGGNIELTGTAAGGVIQGSGTLVLGLLAAGSDDDLLVGKATYVGTDDADTPLSAKIIPITKQWNNKNSPYYSGFGGRCEAWCNKVYKTAGLSYTGGCCAYNHAKKTAHKDGAIPKGALIFSGQKPDGTMYENGHRADAYCTTCHHWAGHAAIYVGGGMVAGSQIPYYMSVDSWIDMFGYGGWSTN